MNEPTHSVALRDKANLLACALEYDAPLGSSFSIALSDGEISKPTHYCFASNVLKAFVDILSSVAYGILPPILWENFRLASDDVLEIIQELYFDKRDIAASEGHYAQFQAANGFSEAK